MYTLLLVLGLSGGFEYTGKVDDLPKYVAEITKLKTCNIKLIEQIIQYLQQQEGTTPEVIEEVMRAISKTCISDDDLIALALAMGIDPALLGGPTASGGQQTQIPIAPVPGNVGSGGGTGSGSPELASGN